jgi:hypothetical protein
MARLLGLSLFEKIMATLTGNISRISGGSHILLSNGAQAIWSNGEYSVSGSCYPTKSELSVRPSFIDVTSANSLYRDMIHGSRNVELELGFQFGGDVKIGDGVDQELLDRLVDQLLGTSLSIESLMKAIYKKMEQRSRAMNVRALSSGATNEHP